MDSYASAFFLLMGIGLLVSRLFSGYIVDKGYLVILVCMADLVALLYLIPISEPTRQEAI